MSHGVLAQPGHPNEAKWMSFSDDYSYWRVRISEFCITAGPIMCKLKPGCLTSASLKYAGGGDNWSYKKSSKIFTTTYEHPTLNRPDALPVAQPTASEDWKQKVSHPMDSR